MQIAQLFFLASLRVYSQQISTAKEKNSTDASAASARFSISAVERPVKYPFAKTNFSDVHNQIYQQRAANINKYVSFTK